LLLGFISAVAFATILAVVAGLTITAAASFAHDIYANVIAKGKADADTEVKVARRTVVVIGILAIVGGIFANGQNVAFLVAFAFAVAASANLPTIIYSLFWRRFTTQGAVWSMYGGLASAILLIALSPVVSGAKTSMIPTANFAVFPLSNPGIVSIPLAFFLGWLGTVLDKSRRTRSKQAEMEVRSLTGRGCREGRGSLAASGSLHSVLGYNASPVKPTKSSGKADGTAGAPAPPRGAPAVFAAVGLGAVGAKPVIQGEWWPPVCSPCCGAANWPAVDAASPRRRDGGNQQRSGEGGGEQRSRAQAARCVPGRSAGKSG
jgi:hypothetical protein